MLQSCERVGRAFNHVRTHFSDTLLIYLTEPFAFFESIFNLVSLRNVDGQICWAPHFCYVWSGRCQLIDILKEVSFLTKGAEPLALKIKTSQNNIFNQWSMKDDLDNLSFGSGVPQTQWLLVVLVYYVTEKQLALTLIRTNWVPLFFKLKPSAFPDSYRAWMSLCIWYQVIVEHAFRIGYIAIEM